MERASQWAAVALGMLLAACGSRYDDLCAEWGDCVDANETDIEACVAEYEAWEDAASESDCDERYESVVSCWESEGRCHRVDSVGFYDDENECESKSEKLDDCMKEWRD